MNRLQPHATKRRLPPRTTAMGGAALGLIAGVAVYSGVSLSGASAAPAAYTAKIPVSAARASAANCSPATTFEKGTCVFHVVRTVVAPSTANAAERARLARLSGAGADGTSRRAGGAKGPLGSRAAEGGSGSGSYLRGCEPGDQESEFGKDDKFGQDDKYGQDDRYGQNNQYARGNDGSWCPPSSAPAPSAPVPVPIPVPTTTPVPTTPVPTTPVPTSTTPVPSTTVPVPAPTAAS